MSSPTCTGTVVCSNMLCAPGLHQGVNCSSAAYHCLQEEEAMESVLEEFKLQKVDISDVVLVTDKIKLDEYALINLLTGGAH